MDRRDVNEARGGTAGDPAATSRDGQDGRDGRDGYGGHGESLGPAGANPAQVPDDFGEPPETLEIIPGRFLHNPVAQPSRASATPTNAPVVGPADTPQQNVPDVTASRPYRSPSAPGGTSGGNPYPAYPQSAPYSGAASSGANGGYSGVTGGQPPSGAQQGPRLESPSTPGPRPEAGPRSVPVLSRYAGSPRPTPGPMPRATSGAISGAVRGAALGSGAAAMMPVVTSPTPEQHPGNGVAPGVGPSSTSAFAAASRSHPLPGPLVVEEVQETVVRDIPVAAQASAGQGIGSLSYPGYRSQSMPSGEAGQASVSSSSVDQVGSLANPAVSSAANPAWRGAQSPWSASRAAPAGQVMATGGADQAEHASALGRGRLAAARQLAWGGTAANNGVVTISLSANNAAGFSYLFGWLSGIFFYFTERANRYVRFHAMQSIILTSLFTVLAVLLYVGVEWLTLTPHDTLTVVLGVSFTVLILLAMLAIWLFTLVAAWSGHYLRLPIVGRLAEHFAEPVEEPYPGLDHTADMPLRA